MYHKIGMVVAINNELLAVFDRLGEPKETKRHGRMDLHVYESEGMTWYIVHSGAGEIGAAAATELLISCYEVDVILNFGVVGGLTDEMAMNRTAVVTKVVHYEYDASEFDPVKPGQYEELPDEFIPTTEALYEKVTALFPNIKPVIAASADKFVGDPDKKRALHDSYGAEICDMESAAIALTCFRHNMPVLIIKTVSDGVTDGAEGFAKSCRSSALLCFDAAMKVFGGIR